MKLNPSFRQKRLYILYIKSGSSQEFWHSMKWILFSFFFFGLMTLSLFTLTFMIHSKTLLMGTAILFPLYVGIAYQVQQKIFAKYESQALQSYSASRRYKTKKAIQFYSKSIPWFYAFCLVITALNYEVITNNY
jgi:hypothetical protein